VVLFFRLSGSRPVSCTLGSLMARLLILVLLAFPTIALANAGLPMLAIVWPMSVPAFIPVVAIESWVVRRALNVSWRVAITQMVKGNIFSTLIGIPLAWVASVAVEFLLAFLVMNATDSKSYPPHGVGEVGGIILSAPWLGPFREGGHWIIPLARSYCSFHSSSPRSGQKLGMSAATYAPKRLSERGLQYGTPMCSATLAYSSLLSAGWHSV